MSERTFYKTVIQLTVLSYEPIPNNMPLDLIVRETEGGEYGGVMKVVSEKKIGGKEAVAELKLQGSEPEFFELDEEGNDTYD